MEADAEQTIAVFAAPDPVTAELVCGALRDAGIPAVIGEQVASAYGGALALGEGYWGEIRVLPEDAERARAVLADLEAGEGDSGQEQAS